MTRRNLEGHAVGTRSSHAENAIFSVKFFLAIVLFACGMYAQGLGDLGENTDPFNPPKTGWIADSLYMGATFLRDTTKDSFVIWLHRNEAGCTGRLYLMVPGTTGPFNGWDSLYLFQNKNNSGPTSVNLTNHPLVEGQIGHLDTLFFMYRVFDGAQWGCSYNPRYTGPNRAPGEGWTGVDRFYSQDYTSDSVSSPEGDRYPIGRRWCVAGWIRDQARNARTDTVEFGFEDLTPGDADFDDIVFHVTGVFLIKPALVTDIKLDAEPADSTILAGDSIDYTATVVIDSVDSFGVHHILDDTMRANNVTWEILGDTSGGILTNGAGPNRRNTFVGYKAYKTFTIRATIIDGSRIVTKEVSVTVLPNVAYQLYLEGAPDTSGGLNLNQANPLDTITVASSAASANAYAIVRDRYQNFVSTSNPTGWAVPTGDTIVEANAGNQAQGQGVITKLGPTGTATVSGTNLPNSGNPLFSDTIAVVVDPASYDSLRYVVGTGGQKRVITALEMKLGQDTLIYAEGRRTDRIGGDDNDGWVRIRVAWSVTANIDSSSTAPASANQWNFAPTDTGSGTITIDYTSLSQQLAVTVTPSDPAGNAIYAKKGMPGPLAGNEPYLGPDVYTYQWEAGRTYNLVSKIFDQYGTWLSQYETDPALRELIGWEVVYTSNGAPIDPTVGVLSLATGDSTTFRPLKAYSNVDIISTFEEGLRIFKDTVRVSIVAGAIDHLVIEAGSDSTISPYADNPLASITLQPSDTTRMVYGILRDAFGNFAGYADSAAWTSRDTTVAKAAQGAQTALGQGEVRRVAVTASQTWAVATYKGLIDSVQVIVQDVNYDSLRIVVNNNGLKDISSLTMRTDQDTTLQVLGRRSDNGQWVYVDVEWQSFGIQVSPSAPALADRWTLQPDSVGAGIIRIVKGSARDSISVTLQPGLPVKLVIYPLEGIPDAGANAPYPPTSQTLDTIAGSTVQFVAKLFDQNNTWIATYEVAGAPVTWNINELSGNPPTGSMSDASGHKTTFSPTRAYNTVDVRATFHEGGITLNDAVRLHIKPGPAHHLAIEPSPLQSESPNSDNPLTGLTIGSTDTVAYAYAILRDQFQNFIGPSPSTDWISLDPAIATAAENVAVNGEGRIVRIANSGSTQIVAANRTTPSLSDTLTVTLSDITYDSIKIVVNYNGLSDISSLVQRTDQDTTLYAIGKRSDNGEWDNIRVNWSSPGLIINPTAPSSADQWSFRPSAQDTGNIIISTQGTGGQIFDTLPAFFTPGLPDKLILFRKDNDPYVGGNTPFPNALVADTLTAGQSDTLAAFIFDHQNTWLGSYKHSSAPITYRIAPISGGGGGSLSATSGYLSIYTDTMAYKEVYIIAELNQDGIFRSDSVRIYVKPDSMHHLVIEESSDRSISPNRNNPLVSITLSSWDTIRSVHAIIRDQFGNYIQPSKSTNWLSLDSSIVTAQEGLAEFGEGIILRRIDTKGATRVAAWNQGSPLLTDTLLVEVNDITYDSLRIVVNDGGLKDIDSLVIRIDQDTTLLALARRSDNNQWDNLQVAWNSANLSLTPSAPSSSDRWTLTPDSTGNGTVGISIVDTSGGTIRDNITVVVQYGLPDKVVLYPLEGTPGLNNNLPYPPRTTVDTLTAGEAVSYVAKVFDKNNNWLAQYEAPTAAISWNVQEISGNPPTANFDPRAGHKSVFTPRNAFNNAYFIAELNDHGMLFADTVAVYVKAGLVHHLVLEPSPDRNVSPNDDNPAGTIVIDTADTVENVYAVLRDQFGNWIDYSKKNSWQSVETIVSVGDGNTNFGEGRIIRASRVGGNTQVIVSNRDNASLRDTVTVVLSSISYTALKIVVGDSTEISDLAMQIEDDTTLFVLGQRSDNNAWEPVPANWAITNNFKTSPAPPRFTDTWTFAPADTGSAWIYVTLGNASADSVAITVEPGDPYKLSLFPRVGSPGPPDNSPYPPPNSVDSVLAGTAFPVAAKLFDKNNIYLGEFDIATVPVSWEIVEVNNQPLNDSLSPASGNVTMFAPVEAYKQVMIIGTYRQGAVTLSDSVQVKVMPGLPHHLVIEPDQNWQSHPNTDNPIDLVTLTNIDTIANVYAIVRDAQGNFVDYSQFNVWASLDTSIVTAIDGIASIGEGVIQKTYSLQDSARTRVAVVSTEFPGLTDTVDVDVLNIHFLALRIVINDSIPVDSLTMSTNDDTTLQVQGQRSDNLSWVAVRAKWLASPQLDVDPAPPENATLWRFSPVRPDSSGGIVMVTLENDSTVPDTLPVKFTRGEPTKVSMQLITPPDKIIAGHEITAVVRLQNKDGAVPGTYCNSALYQDFLGTGGRDSLPDVTVNGSTGKNLNQLPDSSKTVQQCISDGVDTVKFVLYYAPFDDDSLNQLYVSINGLVDSTVRFEVLPDILDNIAIRHKRDSAAAIDDTLNLYAPQDQLLVTTVGFDKYGNMRGEISSDWNMDTTDVQGDLQFAKSSNRTRQFYYNTFNSDFDFDKKGRIAASFVTDSGTFTDTIWLRIVSLPATLSFAATRDASGNGYLDRIYLHFDKPLSASRDTLFFNSTDSIKVSYSNGNVDWLVDSVGVARNDSGVADSSRFILYLAEERNDLPQTAWQPKVHVPMVGLGDSVIANDTMAYDGAGPVIWFAYKEVTNPVDRSRDIVTVIFTEPVRGGGKNDFLISNLPANVFRIWTKTGVDTFVQVTDILTDIGTGGRIGFLTPRSDTLKFAMSNGLDLTADHYISISVDSTNHGAQNHHLVDNAGLFGNAPELNNQRVKMQVKIYKADQIRVGPNPARPAATYTPLSLAYSDVNPATVHKGGTFMQFEISIPPSQDPQEVLKKLKLNGYMNVYDIAGNVVATAEHKDMLKDLPMHKISSGILQYNIFWSGYNENGIKVAPGIYHGILQLQYQDRRSPEKTKLFNVGITR
ncbi:MAG: hypothetical protein GF398_11140 [Chitinivibrionales bacterium]|nr:hypothetical protein [Chitinivibrionales bacterium]